MLALSATPIPRTLELTLYGDLDVSRLDQKPPGRKPVTTTAAPSGRVEQVKGRLRAAVASGAQAFWICPLVAETDLIDVTAAEARAADLRETLGEAAVGLIHGKLPAAEKDRVMAAFAEGRLRRSGGDDGGGGGRQRAERLDHGDRARRAGSGSRNCISCAAGSGAGRRRARACSFTTTPLSQAAQARIEILRQTEDGFLIAEKDLELRGGGDLMGLKQSGFPAYRFADPAAHRDLLLAAARRRSAACWRAIPTSSARGARRCGCCRPCSTGRPKTAGRRRVDARAGLANQPFPLGSPKRGRAYGFPRFARSALQTSRPSSAERG